MSRFILASGSTYKRGLLTQLDVTFESIASDVDETPLPDESPLQVAQRLALAKAVAVGAQHPDALVLGCDQVVALGDRQFHKPETHERAVDQLMALQGRVHDLFCSIALVRPNGEPLEATVTYAMEMRALTRAQADAYIALDTPLDCCGSYALEAHGVRLFSSMRGDDHTAIIGLPLTRVQTLLERAGYFP